MAEVKKHWGKTFREQKGKYKKSRKWVYVIHCGRKWLWVSWGSWTRDRYLWGWMKDQHREWEDGSAGGQKVIKLDSNKDSNYFSVCSSHRRPADKCAIELTHTHTTSSTSHKSSTNSANGSIWYIEKIKIKNTFEFVLSWNIIHPGLYRINTEVWYRSRYRYPALFNKQSGVML